MPFLRHNIILLGKFLALPLAPSIWLLHHSNSWVNYYFLDITCRSDDNCLLYIGERNANCVPTVGESHTYTDLNGIEQSVAAIKECGCSTGWCHDRINLSSVRLFHSSFKSCSTYQSRSTVLLPLHESYLYDRSPFTLYYYNNIIIFYSPRISIL